jgi:predicted NAD/FAD-binding protein
LTIPIRLANIMTGLAIAGAGYFELCAAVLASHGRELDLFGAQRTLFSVDVHISSFLDSEVVEWNDGYFVFAKNAFRLDV